MSVVQPDHRAPVGATLPPVAAITTSREPKLRGLLRRDPWSLLSLPGIALLVVVFGSGLGFVVHRSLTDPGPSTYAEVLSGPYLTSILTTFRAAALVTMVVLILGYAYTYAMTVGPKLLRVVLVALLVAQFATSWLARAYAWQQLLQTNGVINRALQSLGIIDEPLELMRNDLGMVIGTSHVLLPFMVLTLYASMRQVDFTTLIAAESMGARRYQAFWRVLVPATRSGIAAGAGLTFVLTLGFYITPALLGDPTRQTISSLVVRRASQYGEFGVGSALSVVLLVVTLAVLGLTGLATNRISRRSAES